MPIPDYRLARGTSSWLYVIGLIFPGSLAATLFSPTASPVFALLVVLTASTGVLFLLLLNFFRDPERGPAPGIVAPADGVVTLVQELPDGGTRLNTFMHPLDVHVNRAPLPGRVVRLQHLAGSYLPAFSKDSERNERLAWEFETEFGPVRLVQIAGALARRIIPYLKEGDRVEKGERIGIIRLGSRVDLYLPPGLRVIVSVGDRVAAGETQIAALP